MNKNITLIAGIIAVAYVIYSFFGNSEYADIFGFEVNIWTFRLFWSVLAVGILYSYYKKRKAMEQFGIQSNEIKWKNKIYKTSTQTEFIKFADFKSEKLNYRFSDPQ